MKIILSFYVNLLLKLSLSERILITIFSSWIQCLWGGAPCWQNIPASGGLLTKAWRTRSMFSVVLSEGSLPGHFLFAADTVSHPQQYSIANRDTVVPMNIEVPTKYPPRHNDRIVVLEIRLHSETPMLYRPLLHGNWSALSLARRALKEKLPTPKIPLTAVLPNRQVFLLDPVVLLDGKWSTFFFLAV